MAIACNSNAIEFDVGLGSGVDRGYFGDGVGSGDESITVDGFKRRGRLKLRLEDIPKIDLKEVGRIGVHARRVSCFPTLATSILSSKLAGFDIPAKRKIFVNAWCDFKEQEHMRDEKELKERIEQEHNERKERERTKQERYEQEHKKLTECMEQDRKELTKRIEHERGKREQRTRTERERYEQERKELTERMEQQRKEQTQRLEQERKELTKRTEQERKELVKRMEQEQKERLAYQART
ncbi:hypothetical protein Tco_0629289 [Tanacetum coccineum]|uniref:Uncharacterized protein n=1 Tax=Tanacetum coccineum TaxID=301880 RepID=A0ABQ4WSV3_9ASTR